MVARLAMRRREALAFDVRAGERRGAPNLEPTVLPEIRLGDAPLYLVSRPRPIAPRIAALRGHLLARFAGRRPTLASQSGS